MRPERSCPAPWVGKVGYGCTFMHRGLPCCWPWAKCVYQGIVSRKSSNKLSLLYFHLEGEMHSGLQEMGISALTLSKLHLKAYIFRHSAADFLQALWSPYCVLSTEARSQGSMLESHLSPNLGFMVRWGHSVALPTVLLWHLREGRGECRDALSPSPGAACRAEERSPLQRQAEQLNLKLMSARKQEKSLKQTRFMKRCWKAEKLRRLPEGTTD